MSEEKIEFTIRFDFIMLVLELLKIWDKISLSWTALILIMAIPMILGKLLVAHFKKKIEEINAQL